LQDYDLLEKTDCFVVSGVVLFNVHQLFKDEDRKLVDEDG
jgi:hypothetical protein